MLDGCISENDLAKACQRLAQHAASIENLDGITISFSDPDTLIITKALKSSFHMEEEDEDQLLDPPEDEVLCLTHLPVICPDACLRLLFIQLLPYQKRRRLRIISSIRLPTECLLSISSILLQVLMSCMKAWCQSINMTS